MKDKYKYSSLRIFPVSILNSRDLYQLHRCATTYISLIAMVADKKYAHEINPDCSLQQALQVL